MFALMSQASPEITIDSAFDVAATTAFFDDRHGSERPNTRYGEGRIDAYEAVAQVAFNSGITGTVTNSQSGNPVGQATVQAAPVGACQCRPEDEESRRPNSRRRLRSPQGGRGRASWAPLLTLVVPGSLGLEGRCCGNSKW